jgi:hypothetical protein
VRIEARLTERDVLVLGTGPRIEIVPAGEAVLEHPIGVEDAVIEALDRARF